MCHKILVRSVIDVCEAVNLGAKEGTQLYNALDDARQYFEKMKMIRITILHRNMMRILTMNYSVLQISLRIMEQHL